MKFVTVKIPCAVEHAEPDEHVATTTEMGVLEVRLTASDRETTRDVLERLARILERLARILDDKLSLIDIGDCT